MRYLLVLIFILSLTSCEYFNVKKTSSEAILKEELETFNWDEVDAYPTFKSCDSASVKAAKALCFQETITATITHYLEDEKIVVTQDINIKTLLNSSLDGLPELFPALKRGQQVTTAFTLPIVIHVD